MLQVSTDSMDITAVLLGVTAALSAVTGFFLVRFVSKSDAAMDKFTTAIGEIVAELAVHREKHDRHDDRLADHDEQIEKLGARKRS